MKDKFPIVTAHIEDYRGAKVLELLAHEDPKAPGIWGFRAKLAEDEEGMDTTDGSSALSLDFLVIVPLATMVQQDLEEVAFAKEWPPESPLTEWMYHYDGDDEDGDDE